VIEGTTSDVLRQIIREVVKDAGNEYITQIETRLPTLWPRWMTIKTAARYIDHSDRSFEYLMSKDLFPVVRRDRLVLLDREDIDAVLKKLKQ
jgi:hypothetical protein